MSTLPFTIRLRPLLVSGSLGSDNFNNLHIYVDSEQPRNQQRVALWHEVVHLLMSGAGFDEPHDEQDVEAWAAHLADHDDGFAKMILYKVRSRKV